MSKPQTKKEAELRRKFAKENDIPYEEHRQIRVNKRIWKRLTQKHLRRLTKQQLHSEIAEADDN